MSMVIFSETWPVARRDFATAGEVSGKIKRLLKQLGNIDAGLVRRVAVAAYEVELNIVIHSLGGTMELVLSPERIRLTARDTGPGIPDIDMAIREGFSTATDEIRDMGFGAGMGLPNMRRNADMFTIESSPAGTQIVMSFSLSEEVVPCETTA